MLLERHIRYYEAFDTLEKFYFLVQRINTEHLDDDDKNSINDVKKSINIAISKLDEKSKKITDELNSLVQAMKNRKDSRVDEKKE